jgi:hypothetical protein
MGIGALMLRALIDRIRRLFSSPPSANRPQPHTDADWPSRTAQDDSWQYGGWR